MTGWGLPTLPGNIGADFTMGPARLSDWRVADSLRDRAASVRCGRFARLQLARDMHADAWSGEQDQTGQVEFHSPGMVRSGVVVRAGPRQRCVKLGRPRVRQRRRRSRHRGAARQARPCRHGLLRNRTAHGLPAAGSRKERQARDITFIAGSSIRCQDGCMSLPVAVRSNEFDTAEDHDAENRKVAAIGLTSIRVRLLPRNDSHRCGHQSRHGQTSDPVHVCLGHDLHEIGGSDAAAFRSRNDQFQDLVIR